jgi:DNA polymerase
MNEIDSLKILHENIGKCILCKNYQPLLKNPNLKRGNESKLMVIGLSPGKTEISKGIAFSGQAGNKLMNWLIKSGIGENETQIRNNVYFTSLIKCQKNEISDIVIMYRECQKFLKEQVEIISPKIIIPLGQSVFNTIFSLNWKTDDIVGKYFTFDQINDSPLFPEMSVVYGVKYIIAFPHPSGLNRWLNNSKNIVLLEKSIDILNTLYHEE